MRPVKPPSGGNRRGSHGRFAFLPLLATVAATVGAISAAADVFGFKTTFITTAVAQAATLLGAVVTRYLARTRERGHDDEGDQ